MKVMIKKKKEIKVKAVSDDKDIYMQNQLQKNQEKCF